MQTITFSDEKESSLKYLNEIFPLIDVSNEKNESVLRAMIFEFILSENSTKLILIQ